MGEITAEEALRILASGLPLENYFVTSCLDIRKLGNKVTAAVIIRTSKIHTLHSAGVDYRAKFIIDGCHIAKCVFNYSTFDQGADIRDSVFESYVDFETGPHNQSGPFVLENNSFKEFVNFFDCWFQGPAIIKGNTFSKGSNLLGNKGEHWEAKFDALTVVENNQGVIDLDGEGNKQANVVYFNPDTDESFNAFQ